LLSEAEFQLKAPFDDLVLRVRRLAGELTAEQRQLAREAAAILRFGIENDPEILRVAELLDEVLFGAGPSGFRDVGASPASRVFADTLARRLTDELEQGRIVVTRPPQPQPILREDRPRTLPPLPPAPRSSRDTFFEVRFVDEIGQAINGLSVAFDAGTGEQNVTTNAAGVALLQGVQAGSANVSVPEFEELGKILHPRWSKLRPGKAPKESNTFETFFQDDVVGPFSLRAALPHTVVIKPPLGKILLELWDKTGRALHRQQRYEIAGPMPQSGTTGDDGRLLHENLLPGDYMLTLTVKQELPGQPPSEEKYEIPSVVLAPPAAAQLRMVGAVPESVMVRIRGLVFEKNKTFVLPSAIDGLAAARELYDRFDPGELLIVGHADTTAEPSVNDPLSLERAESVQAFLEDDADAWLQNYDKSGKGKWGAREDGLMLRALLGAGALEAEGPELGPNPTGKDEPDRDLVRFFQRTRGLQVDGVAGPETRKQLIREYMELDGTAFGDDAERQLTITTHGCGEHFPLDSTGLELDQRAVAERDEEDDPIDRRVELFFFDPEFGILPKPPGRNSKAGSTEYSEWRKGALEVLDFPVEPNPAPARFVELHDALFRTDSAVLMPEGEAPSEAEHASLTSVGILARTLRFAQEAAPKKLLIAGHTDTEGSKAYNQPLSEERAELTHALLTGKRATFTGIAEKRHKVADIKQILSWMSVAYPEFFACDPGAIDDEASTAKPAIAAFQEQYNANRDALGASDQPELGVDGAVGPLTWGAIFDVFEHGLRDELGEDSAGVAALRAGLDFLADDLEHIGFGEKHPLEGKGKDEFVSQTNRRVEILFFDPGEEPDPNLLRNTPELTEIYDPDLYVRVPVELDFPISQQLISPLRVFLHDEERQRMGARKDSPVLADQIAGAAYRIVFPDGEVRSGHADPDGLLVEDDVRDFETCRVYWGRRDDEAEATELPQTDEEADAYFSYRGTLVLHGSRGRGRTLELLANLGHAGDETARRAGFAKFYTDSTDAVIRSVHDTGKPA
jgi:outer membrane protein OmpA-like peptidoglycan-associated protein